MFKNIKRKKQLRIQLERDSYLVELLYEELHISTTEEEISSVSDVIADVITRMNIKRKELKSL